eukprot:gene28651-37632_t
MMQIISANDGSLTNLEVLELIQEKRGKNSILTDGQSIELQNREYIEKKAIDYIKGTTVGRIPSVHMKECIKSLISLDCGLTEAEIIQIANACPQSDVEFYLIIEDCSDRLDEEKMAQIKEITESMLNYDGTS